MIFVADLEGNRKLSIDGKQLRTTLQNKLSVVILGNNYATKCECVNWLLHKQILPVHNASWIKKASTVHLKHSSKSNGTFTLSNNQVLPMMDDTDASIDICQSLSKFADKCFPLDDENSKFHDVDEEIKNADIEILLEAAILQGNTQILLKDFDMCTDKTRKCPFKKLLQNVIPIFIYTLSSYTLSSTDMKTLTDLNEAYEDSAIFFWMKSDSSEPTQHQVQCESFLHCKPERNLVSLSPVAAVDVETCACNAVSDNDFLENGMRERISCCCVKHCESSIATEEENTSHGLHSDRSLQAVPLCLKNETNFEKGLTFNFPHLQETLESMGFHFAQSNQSEETSPSTVQTEQNFDSHHHHPVSVLFKNEGADESFHDILVSFVRKNTLSYLIKAAESLNKYHEWRLDEMIYLAFALSRNVMITPKKMLFAYQAEEQLYKKLLQIATHKQAKIMQIIAEVKLDQKENILDLSENTVVPCFESDTSVTEGTAHIQNMVLKHIKNAAAEKLASTIDVLRETMVGTLSRCIESLQLSHADNEEANDLANDASAHLKMILNATYYVEVSIQSSSSLLKVFIDKIRKMLRTLTWKEISVRDATWKRIVAEDVLNNICENRLAKNMCTQLQLQLQKSHEAFRTAMNNIEERQKGRIRREQQEIHNASKVIAPKVAQLALRSRSALDEILYGAPSTAREIGRGSYGVVFACSSWPAPVAKGKQCAVKSVVPPDQKHLNDLALEFYYSVKLPPHPRIVQLFGSVVDYSYGEGFGSPAVLMIMERMLWDLHRALQNGISERDRMGVSLDVIEGIRYLHGQGLVHRDIKLKNILLDSKHRAKITDLGFCKPSAMISGSIVGTPVHMPPELFSGQYDSSVDVYAFGILFWHLCAGTTSLPKRYTQWSSKDHLWNAVKQGVRPECRPEFRDDCWALMQQCWVSEPSERPIPGIIHDRLLEIMKDFESPGKMQE